MARDKVVGIYAIQNVVSGRIYIGQSIDVLGRFIRHRCKLKKGKHENLQLQRSYNKYGAAAFEFLIIEECAECELNTCEQYWIDTNSGLLYNTKLFVDDNRGCKNSFFGKQHTPQTRALISQARTGKYTGADNPNYGRIQPPEVRRKMGINRATKLTPDNVMTIRGLLAAGVYHKDIAAKFNVSRTVITRINSGARWALVK